MKQRLLFVLALTCITPRNAFALDPGRSLEQYSHTAWSQKDGAPADIRAIVQTPDGLLWLGTASGVYRFDGVRFEHIKPIPHDRARSEQIHRLLVARDGTVWVGYRRGGLAVFRDGRLQPMPSPGGQEPVLQIVGAPDGAVWVVSGLTHGRLSRYFNRHWSSFGPMNGLDLNDEFVASIAFTPNGSCWVAGFRTLFLRRPGQPRFVSTSVPIGPWATLAVDSAGRPWLSGTNGIRPVPNAEAPDAPINTAPIAAPFSDTYTPIVFDRHGILWAATAGGLGRVRPGEKTLELFDVRQGLSGEGVRTVMEDREGNIWSGTNAGLDRLRNANVTRALGIPVAPDQNYHIASDHHGTVYISAGDALFRVPPGSGPQRVGGRIPTVRALCDSASGMWVMTDRGPWHEAHGGLERIPPPAQIGTPEGCAEDRTGALWSVDPDIGLWRYAGGRWQDIKPPGIDLDKNFARHIAVNSQGQPLVSFDGLGIARFDGLNFSVPWRFKDLSIGRSIFMSVLNDDIFVGAQYGLARLRGQTVAVLDADRFPWLHNVSAIAKFSAGETWLVTSSGVIRLTTDALNAAFDDPRTTLTPEHFDSADGVPGPLSTGAGHGGALGAAAGADGRFWFFGDKGVAFIDPARMKRNPLPPAVLISTVTTNGVSRSAQSGLILPKGSSSLRIDYTATSLSIPERIRFRYQLTGVDQGWVDPGSRREAFYTKLGPGRYHFRVIASNNDGVWNNHGATLTFIIPPTFLQSWKFLLLCVLAGAMTLWWLYTMRLRQVAGRIRDRLEQRIAERERIARELHDTLLQGFQGLLLRFQAAADTIPADHSARLKMNIAMDLAEAVLCEGRDRVKDLRKAQPSGGLAKDLSLAAARLVVEPAVAHVLEIGQARSLHPKVQEEACRIGEEAIANAARHAEATLIEVNIVYAHNQLRLSIVDNGRGLDPDIVHQGQRTGHFGLAGMRERAEQIKGEITISNRQGAGAQISLAVPSAVAYLDPSGRAGINAIRRLASGSLLRR
jgi:signal transduction histidine kinase/ligand-binding sensor domain-containing protein